LNTAIISDLEFNVDGTLKIKSAQFGRIEASGFYDRCLRQRYTGKSIRYSSRWWLGLGVYEARGASKRRRRNQEANAAAIHLERPKLPNVRIERAARNRSSAPRA
jgi:hypothetical protein